MHMHRHSSIALTTWIEISRTIGAAGLTKNGLNIPALELQLPILAPKAHSELAQVRKQHA
jgi:hypothetical protein